MWAKKPAVFDLVKETYGTMGRLDMVISNAWAGHGVTNDEDWDQVLRVRTSRRNFGSSRPALPSTHISQAERGLLFVSNGESSPAGSFAGPTR